MRCSGTERPVSLARFAMRSRTTASLAPTWLGLGLGLGLGMVLGLGLGLGLGAEGRVGARVAGTHLEDGDLGIYLWYHPTSKMAIW